jgi:hypothetical protein
MREKGLWMTEKMMGILKTENIMTDHWIVADQTPASQDGLHTIKLFWQ